MRALDMLLNHLTAASVVVVLLVIPRWIESLF